jgi:hypothetical protein
VGSKGTACRPRSAINLAHLPGVCGLRERSRSVQLRQARQSSPETVHSTVRLPNGQQRSRRYFAIGWPAFARMLPCCLSNDFDAVLDIRSRRTWRAKPLVAVFIAMARDLVASLLLLLVVLHDLTFSLA